MTKLIDLQAQFLRYEEREDTWTEVVRRPYDGEDIATIPTKQVTGMWPYYIKVDSIKDAQGVKFLCPLCFRANGGAPGTHRVICWSKTAGAPDKAEPGPGRWRLVGTGLHDLTLDAEPGKSRSVLLNGGCKWHGFVTNGDAV